MQPAISVSKLHKLTLPPLSLAEISCILSNRINGLAWCVKIVCEIVGHESRKRLRCSQIGNTTQMKTIETTVYEFDELSDSAKDKARDWYRNGALYYEWWDSTYEDAESVGLKITGFDLDRNRHCTGSLKTSGTLCAARIHKEHGPSCETFKTATAFLADLAKLNAEIAAVDGDDETNCEYEEWQDKRTELETEFEKSLLEDYSILLQHECEYLLSDDQANESIVANGYTFTEEGKRF